MSRLVPDVNTVPASFTIIVNPVAGRGRAQKALPALAAAAGSLVRDGVDIELRVSTTPEEPARIAADAFARGRAVVAGGGDGLANQLAPVAIEHRGVLGIVPLGSGNDMARALDLDHRDPVAALRLLEPGRAGVRTVDVARANGRVVLTVAASGFDSEANRWANTVTRFGGTPLYLAAVARTLATYRPHRFRLSIDDGPSREITAWLVAVANTASYGGGMRIAPHARFDDGLLDVIVVGPISRPGFLRTFPGVFSGRHVAHPLVKTARARRVNLESLDPSVPIESYGDGERIGALPTEVTVDPGALRMLGPA